MKTTKDRDFNILLTAIQAVDQLMAESQGVAGLHLNGDVATWEELKANWLEDLEPALEVLAEYS